MSDSTAPTRATTASQDNQSSTPEDLSRVTAASKPADSGPPPSDADEQDAAPEELAEPSASGDAISIVFEDIQLPIQADVVFRPFMLTDRVRELDGKRIRINGYMLPDSKTKGIRQFVLLKNTECKFGPGGQADHLINVLMVEGESASYRDDPITVEGVLSINPFQGPDGNTWSIYDLACDHIEKYRPRRNR